MVKAEERYYKMIGERFMKHFKWSAGVLLSVIALFSVLTGANVNALADTRYVEASLTVGENIVTNYYIDYGHYKALGADTLYYSYNSTSEEEAYTLSETTIDLDNIGDDVSLSDGKITFSVTQAAAQLAEPVTIRLYNSSSDETVYSLTYSAKDYCDDVIEMDNSALAPYTQGRGASRLKNVCKAIIAYSKATQSVFTEYMENSGAVEIVDDYSAELGLDSASYASDYNKATDNIPGENVAFKTASFICTSSSKMRFYFTVNDESDTTYYGDPVITGPGASFEKGYTTENGIKSYYIQVNNIKPVDFDKKISVSYAGASISMSVLDYASRIISLSNDNELKGLAKTLIVYYQKADEYFNAEIHNMTPIAAAEASCTETGNSAYYYCEDCGKYFTDAYGENETTAEAVTIAPLGHSYEASVTAPTCTEQGYTTYTCTRCGDTYTDDFTNPVAHTEAAAVRENEVAATCTADGSYDEVVYCSVCNTELSRTPISTSALGHDFGGWAVTTGATLNADGVETKSCSRCGATETRTVKNFSLKFENTADYLYRIGNANNVTLGALFNSASGADITGVTATVTNKAGNAAGTFTANASDWRSSTLKFTGTGVVTVTLKHGSFTAATLNLEVVAATNTTTALAVTSSRSVVLLNDISITSALSVAGGTLYGNGFTVDSTGTVNSSGNTVLTTYAGTINLSSGTLNNVKVIGPNFKNAAVYYSDTNNVFTVKTSGECYIYNCYIAYSRAPLGVYNNSGVATTVENTVLDGGRYSNAYIKSGDLNLHNVTTIAQPRETINGNLRCGFGIVISDEATDSQITATGYLKQYNWVGKSKDKSYFSGDNENSTGNTAISTLFDGMYSKAGALTVSYGGDTYINTGILCLNNSVPLATGSALGAYTTVNPVSMSGSSAWAMAPTALDSSNDFKYYGETEYEPTEQIPTVPSFNWNYPSTYKDGVINLSYDAGSSVSFNPNILTANKMNNNLTVKYYMNGTEYTGSSISFNNAGTYTVEYRITDPYNYASDGVTTSSRTYTKKLNVVVTEHVASISAPEFTFYDTSGSSLGSRVVEIGGAKYVMPNVTATSDTVQSTTVNGTTVYCPVVNCAFKDNSSDFNYISPVFTGVNIKNYTDASGTSTTYNKSSDLSALPSADNAKLEWLTTWTVNGKSMTDSYQKNSSYGLAAYSAAMGKDLPATTKVIQFKFTAGNGDVYYYYIYYSAAAHTCPSSCVAEGSLVTMADGTKKPIEEVQQGDMVLTWSFWNGCYEAQPVVVKWNHGTQDWEILTLNFSDGTSVRVINEHGFFDTDKNTYAYITPENAESFVGDSFVKCNDDGTYNETELTGYSVSVENTGCYCMLTAHNTDFIVEGMLSNSAETYCEGLYEYFEVGENLKYDEEKMKSDIETYGLFTYDDLSAYVTEEQFELLNGAYYKVNIEKGIYTFDEFVRMIQTYIE